MASLHPHRKSEDDHDMPGESRGAADQLSDAGDVEKVQSGGTDEFPEGGARAWGVALGAAGVLFATLGYVNSFGVYQTYYQEHQLKTTSPSTIAWIGSLQAFFLFSGTLFGGPLFDRYGEKIMPVPALLYIVSIMMTSLCKELWQFILAQGLLGGVSAGMSFAPSVAAVGQYFNQKRGAAIGMGIAGSSLGGVVLPIVLNELLRKPNLGFGWSVRILGFVILAVLAPSTFLIRARLPPRTSSFFILSAFREPAFVTLVAAGFFLIMGMFPPMFFLPSYAIAHGMGSKLAFYLVAILNAASFPGRVLPGILADKLGRMNMLFLSGISTGILALCWQTCKSNASILVFTVLFGFCSGAIISGSSVSLASAPKDARNIGTYLGMGTGLAALAVLVGPPSTGAMVNHYHEFSQVSIFSGVICIIGGFLVIPAKIFAGHELLSKH